MEALTGLDARHTEDATGVRVPHAEARALGAQRRLGGGTMEIKCVIKKTTISPPPN